MASGDERTAASGGGAVRSGRLSASVTHAMAPRASGHDRARSNRRPVRVPPDRNLHSSLRARRRTRWQVMQDILSKVSASGLSAGVFLLWWPAHVSSQGSEALLVRGVLWALAFEVLLLGFRPLERAVGRAVRAREARALAPPRHAPGPPLAARPRPARGRAAAPPPAPATLLSGARAPVAAPARAAAPKVIVKREIVRREVVVRRVSHVVRVPVPAARTATPATAAAPKATVRTTTAKPARTTTPAKKATATAKTPAATTADTKPDVSASATTTAAKPAVTATTTQPTTTAGPAAATSAGPPAAANSRAN